MKIEVLKIADLIPLERNVRKHNDKQIAEFVRSLDQFGQTRAIIIDENNNILIGNGLYIAMKQRGDETAECSRMVGLTETQKKKLVITDNKIFSLGIDDYSVITDFINDITLDGDFDIAGFDDDVIRQMTKELDEVNEDVMDYGTVPDGAIKTQEPVHAVSPSGNTEYREPVQQHVERANTEQHVAPAQPQAVVAEVKTDRTIICPSCGEVIHLD